MPKIIESDIPENALTTKYKEQNAFVDAYYIDIPKDISLQQFIYAFYTSKVFKVERGILSIATRRNATDQNAIDLSIGKIERYSIWSVEQRIPDQLLMCEFTEHTRSWFKVEKQQSEEGNSESITTRLYFGSVVVPKTVTEKGEAKFGFIFHLLSGFHKIYSKSLLSSAYKKLSS